MPSVKYALFLLLFFTGAKLFSQDFYGYVKKGDSAVFQARVDVKEGLKDPFMLKTFPNGGYKFPLNKGSLYLVKISYPDHNDTTFTFRTDKNGKPSAQNVTVKLKKSGVFLYGTVRTQAEFFPIKDVTVVLKNVMTREERRFTTAKDGNYKFKLAYENNYRLTVDKRSPGMFNKYRDTVMYISTIGIDLPLDYRLDIRLEEDHEKVTEGIEDYDPNQVNNKELKPEVDVVTKVFKRKVVIPDVLSPTPEPPVVVADTSVKKPIIKIIEPEVVPAPEVKAAPKAEEAAPKKSMAELKRELDNAQKNLDELKKKEADAAKKVERDAAIKKKQKEKGGVDVEIIPDSNQLTPAQLAKQREEAEKRVKDIEAEIATLKNQKK